MKTALKILFFLPTIIFSIIIILDLFDFIYKISKFKKSSSKLKFKYIPKLQNNKVFLICGVIIILTTIHSRHIDFCSFLGLYFIETALLDSYTIFSDDFIWIQKVKIPYNNIESLLCQKTDFSNSKKRILRIIDSIAVTSNFSLFSPKYLGTACSVIQLTLYEFSTSNSSPSINNFCILCPFGFSIRIYAFIPIALGINPPI